MPDVARDATRGLLLVLGCLLWLLAVLGPDGSTGARSCGLSGCSCSGCWCGCWLVEGFNDAE